MSLFSRFIDALRRRQEERAFSAAGIFKKAQANLEAGILTGEGFLGRDTRGLARILAEDAGAFRALGLDWAQVADRLEEWTHKGSEGLGEPITVGSYLVRVAETRGMFACPWEDGFFHKRSTTVRRLEGGQPVGPELLYSDLSVHLVREHHFLQGHGSPFRLEPAHLAAILKED